MSRYFITLAYNGKNYVGWQIQHSGMSVQQVLQEALSVILRTEIRIVGAGRTDAGVHAREMVAHFDWEGECFSPDELLVKLNNFLPKDISLFSIRAVKPDAHARFSALSRTYRYYVTTRKDPFGYPFTYRIFFEPDLERMNELSEILTNCIDFTSFSKLHTDVKTNICRVDYAHWVRKEDVYVFTITADRFLRNMVRAIVGTLLKAARGQIEAADFRNIIDARDRSAAGDSAPGNALFLEKIEYPENIWL